MPTAVSYPGVYIEEVSSGVRTITGVATSITAFIGPAKMGPTHEPISIKSTAEYHSVFGSLTSDSMMGYSLGHFFANGGTDAVVVRVAPHDALPATITLPGDGGDLVLTARGEGEWANNRLRARVETGAATGDDADPQLFNLFIELTDKNGNLRDAEPFRNVSVDPNSGRFVKNVLEDNSSYVRVGEQTIPGQAPRSSAESPPEKFADSFATVFYEQFAGGGDDPDGDGPGEAVAAFCELKTVDGRTWTFEAREGGEVGNNFRLRVEGVEGDPSKRKIIEWQPGTSNAVDIDFAQPELTEQKIKEALNANLSLVKATQVTASKPLVHQNPDLKVAFAVGGEDGGELSDADYTRKGHEAEDDGEKKGLYALKKADLFNLLCVPPPSRDVDTSGTVYKAALKLCHDRRAFLLVDSKADWKTAKAVDANKVTELRNALDPKVTKNAAVFFPRIHLPDQLRNNNTAEFTPSGAIAGIIATTDATRGVWKAPAGIEAGISGVRKFSVKLNDDDSGDLNPLGVNCLRRFPVYGNVIWGARTLDGADRLASEHKYIPIRRLTLFIEESLYRGTQWVVFEPNDEPLWAQIRLNVGVFMNDLFRKGAFQGRTAKEAYFVKCDSTTTTQSDINQGRVNIDVGFAPLKPAEFVIIRIQQIVGDLGV